MTYDLARLRSQFPALDLGVAHFDSPGGSQVPTPVARAVAATMTAGRSGGAGGRARPEPLVGSTG